MAVRKATAKERRGSGRRGSRRSGAASRGAGPARRAQATPADEAPRERLLACGPQVLSDAELVAVLFQNGCSGQAALHRARELLAGSKCLATLRQASLGPLLTQGLSEARAAAVLAAVEIGRRLARAELPTRRPLDRPELVASYLVLRYSRSDQEIMGALFLDTRRRLISEREIYRGTLSRTLAEPRKILKEALLTDAAGVLLFHTHPSGDPAPSLEDHAFTRRMAKAGELMGVRLLDHMIVTPDGRWVSMLRQGGRG